MTAGPPPGPILFAFGLHLHQPVGNFDAVFEQHLEDVYRPLLRALEGGELLPVTLHLSGPLLEWLDAHAADLLDQIGRLVAENRMELLASGYDEPILAALSRADRVEQIATMRDAIRRRFGVDPTGLWLTERVWEPDLAGDLAEAGVAYVLVDDWHFLASGFDRRELHRPFRTESNGRRLGVFPIDEHLRYLIPFRPVPEFAAYLAALRRQGHQLAVLADDGEKLGGWPGTRDWVYQRGWLDEFRRTLAELRDAGAIELTTFRAAYDRLPSGGLAYLPSSAYREMEAWALPPGQARRLAALERELGERRQGPEGSLLRGTHWRHFLVKYPEANRMHKKALTLSRICRDRGDPPATRRAIGKAQCNDAYWHGVFGGLYLPHLRAAVWRHLALAEAMLRRGEGLAWDCVDYDDDGAEELWIHSDRCSVILSPGRGGRIEELTCFAAGVNYAAVLTRRREAYHETAAAAPAGSPPEGGTPSIHDLEPGLTLDHPPPVDPYPRALATESLLAGEVTREDLEAGVAPAIRTWAAEPFDGAVEHLGDQVRVTLVGPGLHKELRVDRNGALRLDYRWDPPPAAGAWFCAELSLAFPLAIGAPGADRWTYPIETIAKSERGFDRTRQGDAIVLRWPAERGQATVTLAGPEDAASAGAGSPG